MNPVVSLIFFVIVFTIFIVSIVCAIKEHRAKKRVHNSTDKV